MPSLTIVLRKSPLLPSPCWPGDVLDQSVMAGCTALQKATQPGLKRRSRGPFRLSQVPCWLPAAHTLHCSAITHLHLSAGQLLQRYKQMLDSGVLQPDVRQQETVSQLSVLADQLLKYKEEVEHFADKLEAYQVCCVQRRAAGREPCQAGCNRALQAWVLLAAAAL